jgi:hypothetical protein
LPNCLLKLLGKAAAEAENGGETREKIAIRSRLEICSSLCFLLLVLIFNRAFAIRISARLNGPWAYPCLQVCLVDARGHSFGVASAVLLLVMALIFIIQ